ncbi:hypothetical protein C9374_012909 [Naegleria lovaniensis]|uniref:Uncharacterized protein n=1 Tax=Naegleria lovaniensis TaxID=51637 RepID=A0AA88GDZ0_NAELO|nr:uncharacterized protein C9374_012909 [Naegleria lovaniensis]KAG2373063.1 hypothetical protein C9374_012909 [Naegleria lovaniensis]
MLPTDFNTFSYAVRKPGKQFFLVSAVVLGALFVNRTHYAQQGKSFENHLPTKETWEWYDKHCARQGENQDITMKDHSVNIPHMMGKFDKREETDSNPFYQALHK